MSTTIDDLVTMCETALGGTVAAATWGDTVLTDWVGQAIVAFPILRPVQWQFTAEVLSRTAALPADYREVISLEYPIEQDPPSFKTRLSHLDPTFYESDDYYDIDRDYVSMEGYQLFMSFTPALAAEVNLNYLAIHSITPPREGELEIAIPEEYYPIVIADVVSKAFRERLSVYMQNPTAYTTIIYQMYEMVQHAEDRHTALLADAMAKLSSSRRTPIFKLDKFDRLY